MKHTSLVPDGRNWWCGVCNSVGIVRLSYYGDACCARCGSLLWPCPPTDQQTLHAQLRLVDVGARFTVDVSDQAWRIDLSQSSISDSDLADLSTIGRVSELYLSDCAVSDVGLRHLEYYLSILKVLDLTHTNISDHCAQSLQHLHRLEVLHLAETDVTDECLTALDNPPHLWCLDLDRTRVTGSCFRQIDFLGQLELLFLSQTQIDDRTLESLAGAQRLEEIWLHETPVTPEGIASLRRALPHCKVHSDSNYD